MRPITQLNRKQMSANLSLDIISKIKFLSKNSALTQSQVIERAITLISLDDVMFLKK